MLHFKGLCPILRVTGEGMGDGSVHHEHVRVSAVAGQQDARKCIYGFELSLN